MESIDSPTTRLLATSYPDDPAFGDLVADRDGMLKYFDGSEWRSIIPEPPFGYRPSTWVTDDFDTSCIVNLSDMFQTCVSIDEIDISFTITDEEKIKKDKQLKEKIKSSEDFDEKLL